jgi:hypothetical protein
MEAKMQNRVIRRKPVKPPAAVYPGTMLERQLADMAADDQGKDVRVVGASALPVYPPQPPNSPWAWDPVGDEPPLGYSVDDLPDMEKVDR